MSKEPKFKRSEFVSLTDKEIKAFQSCMNIREEIIKHEILKEKQKRSQPMSKEPKFKRSEFVSLTDKEIKAFQSCMNIREEIIKHEILKEKQKRSQPMSKEPKFKIGDRVFFKNENGDRREFRVCGSVYHDKELCFLYRLWDGNKETGGWLESFLQLVEITTKAPKFKIGDKVRIKNTDSICKVEESIYYTKLNQYLYECRNQNNQAGTYKEESLELVKEPEPVCLDLPDGRKFDPKSIRGLRKETNYGGSPRYTRNYSVLFYSKQYKEQIRIAFDSIAARDSQFATIEKMMKEAGK